MKQYKLTDLCFIVKMLLIASLFFLFEFYFASCTTLHKTHKAKTQTTTIKYNKHGKVVSSTTVTKY